MRKKHEGSPGNAGGKVIPDEVTIEAKKISRSTNLAWGISTGEFYPSELRRAPKEKLIWLAKSLVVLETHSKDRTLHDIRMPRWLAEEKFPDEHHSGSGSIEDRDDKVVPFTRGRR